MTSTEGFPLLSLEIEDELERPVLRVDQDEKVDLRLLALAHPGKSLERRIAELEQRVRRYETEWVPRELAEAASRRYRAASR